MQTVTHVIEPNLAGQAFGAACRSAIAAAFADPELGAVVIARAAGEEIYGQGESADHVYQLRSGAVRTYRILADGRRQISGFYLPGDILGIEATDRHCDVAEGMTDVTLAAVRRTGLARRAAEDNALTRELWDATVTGMRRSQDHASILARLGATERVAAFLVDLANRLEAHDEMELPMTRQDIADYIGLTIHTVSRTLSQLQGLGVIDARSSRRVRLKRHDDLLQMCA